MAFLLPSATRSMTKVMFSVCLLTGGVHVVQNFSTRCPTDLVGGGVVPVVQIFTTRCPTDLVLLPVGGGGGVQGEFFFQIFFPWIFSNNFSGGGGPEFYFFQFYFFGWGGGGSGCYTTGVPLLPPPSPTQKKKFQTIFFSEFFCLFLFFQSWPGGARAVRLLRSRRRTVLFRSSLWFIILNLRALLLQYHAVSAVQLQPHS